MALVIDTGPLLAAIDRGDPDHDRCRELLVTSREPRLVPAPVLGELDYWCRIKFADSSFTSFLRDVLAGSFRVEALVDADYRRVVEIQEQYSDTPVGFVDASVLAIVERLNEPRLATLDHRHFTMMRPAHVANLELVP